MQVAALTASLSHMSRLSWHRQAGLEAAVNAVRPDLDHEVRVDMMLGIALAVPGHHIPPIMRLGGLAARRTSSAAHRSPTSYKCVQAVHASAPAIEAPRVENVMAAWPSHAAMRPYISGRAAVATRPADKAAFEVNSCEPRLRAKWRGQRVRA